MSRAVNITLLADSLAMARPPEEVDGIRLEETYPYLVDQHFRQQYGGDAPVFHVRGRRARTVLEVLEDWPEEVVVRGARLVVVQVGIADCAPRVFSRRQHQFIETLRSDALRRAILGVVHRHRRKIIRWRPQCKYVSESRFHTAVHDLATWARRKNAAKLLLVNILRPDDSLEERSPGFKSSVEAYNAILAKYVDDEHVYLCDLAELAGKAKEACTTDDGIHLNRMGHHVLADQLISILSRMLDVESIAMATR